MQAYNSRVATTLSYVWQMFDLPKHVAALEWRTLHIFKLPPQSLCMDTFFQLDAIGLRMRISIKMSSTAASIRFANRTLFGKWQAPMQCWLSRSRPSFHHADFVSFLAVRIARVYVPIVPETDPVPDAEMIVTQMKGSKPIIVLANLRTWTNGWTTSSRMHESMAQAESCVVGCDEKENKMSHYLMCPTLWRELIADLGIESLQVDSNILRSIV
jgi:hypothetical protein